MNLKTLFLALFIAATPFMVFSQCKGFAKKACLPKMAPFTHNGQLNSTSLFAGQKVELEMTFYSGQNYRVLVCGQEVLGKVDFRLMDSDKNVVFNSKENGSPDHWDFNLKSTQQLFIEVEVPDNDASNGINVNGCIALLVGFKN